jgi:hypothetical protein
MAFQVSPGVNISEIDLTSVIPSVSTTEGAIGGSFGWGPIGKFVLVDSENTLAARYGKPTNNNAETFFTAANFLAYGNRLYVSRAAKTNGFSNTVGSISTSSNTTIFVAGATTFTAAGITAGQAIYGAGITEGTTVSSLSANATHQIAVISANATATGTASLNFYDLTNSYNAVANSTTAVTRSSYIIKNADHYESVSVPTGVEFVARYPGDLGNSLKISVCDNATQYKSVIDPYAFSTYTNTSVIPGSAGITLNVNESSANVFIANSATLNFATTYVAAGAIKDSFTIGDYVEVGNSTIGKQYLKVKSIGALANTGGGSPTGQIYFNLTFEAPYQLSTNYAANTVTRNWEYFNNISTAPGTSSTLSALGSTAVDQLSAVVVDQDGKFSGVPGTILEVFQNVSRATDAKNIDGTTNYYKTVINDGSNYVWATNDRTTAPSNTAINVINSTGTVPYVASFVGGADGTTESTVALADLASAYDLFQDASSVDVSLIMTGKARGGTNGEQLANYLIDNIAENRKDCIVFVSPEKADVFGTVASGSEATNIVTFRNSLRASSYAFIDSGYKYQYDKYNDINRWIPLNGDIAGLTARTDTTRDPWFSPAGYNRGQIKNLVKLAYNPSQADRDILYKNSINPVMTKPGQGTVLFGDKTALNKGSAFDHINVRRLFIILEKTISTAAQSTLFEFNDEFTRAQFKNLVEPFLRDVQGRRGIYDFRVVCDETNNTSEVIDSNRFVGDIYVKPAASINFIQLNFVAVRSGVEFTEVVGQF